MVHIFRIVASIGLFVVPMMCLAALPPGMAGKYIGIGDEKSLNHDTGKLRTVVQYPVEITIDSSGDINIDYTDMGNAIPYSKPIYGAKIVTIRRQHSNGVVSMGKLKVTGKGNKIKGILSFSGEEFWAESTLSLTKVP